LSGTTFKNSSLRTNVGSIKSGDTDTALFFRVLESSTTYDLTERTLRLIIQHILVNALMKWGDITQW